MSETKFTSSLSDVRSIDEESSQYCKRTNKTNCTSYIFIIAAYSTLALSSLGLTQSFPVFPSIGKSKGLSDTEIGLIFSMQSFPSAFLFPVCSIILTKLDKKLVLCVNSFLAYCMFIMSGLLPVMSPVPFQVYAFVFDCLQAVNETMMYLSTNLIMWELFPDKQSTMIALQELSIAIGYVSGPAACAILYPLIGYFYMYLLVGVIGLILTMVIIAILCCTEITTQHQVIHNDKQTDTWIMVKILLTPSMCLHIVVTFFTAFFFNYFTPIIGPYLISRYHVTISTVGWVIASGEFVYLVFSLIMGYLFDNCVNSFYITVAAFGLLLQALGVLLYPPSSLIFPFKGNYLTISFVGSILNAAGISFCYIPILASLLTKAEKKFPSVSNVDPSVAGIFTGAYSLGEGAGQFVSGVLADLYPLDYLCAYLSGFLLMLSFSLFIAAAIWFKELR